MNVLLIGAHCDDIELGCGGAALMHLDKRDEVFVLIASDGEKGFSGERGIRVKESSSAFAEAGVKKQNMFFLHLPDTMLPDNRKVLYSEIETICTKHNIKKVYTQSVRDYHQDHQTVFEETLRAARKVPTILTYASNAHTMPNFSPNYFIDITKFFEQKKKMIAHHETQKHKDFMKASIIEATARCRGVNAGTEYAEAFELIKMVE